MSCRLWLSAVLLLAFGTAAHAVAPAPAAEIRIVIDVSGSMKRNDPQNLRQPALRLLANLLPTGSTAGAWIFAENPDLLMPLGTVNDDWRNEALASSRRIHSQGLFTDIDAALRTATADWRQTPADNARVLILLTDGMVDISKDQALNEASRTHILSHTLPELQAADACLHILALSANTDAALLQELAMKAGGSFNQIDDAVLLERLFLHVFERSVPHDALPLTGNRFQVDRHVMELTLLAFHAPDADPMRLRAPSGAEYGIGSAPETMRWHSETNYDLVTIDGPETGQWRLLGVPDPDNRIMVLTDLKLKVDPIPDPTPAGEQVTLHAQLTEAGAIITQPDLLALTRLELERSDGADSRHQTFEHATADGEFTATLDRQLGPGTWQLIIRAHSPTFSRERRLHLTVLDPPATATPETSPSRPMTAPVNWPLVIIVLTTANISLLMLALLAFHLYRTRRPAPSKAYRTTHEAPDSRTDGAAP